MTLGTTAILVCSHTAISGPTQVMLDACRRDGAQLQTLYGVSDIALARNRILTVSLEAIKRTTLDTVLLIDDDISAPLSHVQELVHESRSRKLPVSGVYANAEGIPNAIEWPLTGKWLTGLGFIAIPVAALEALKARTVEGNSGEDIKLFCQSGYHVERPGFWTSEDYWLCLQLGGVMLAPIPADHYKRVPVHVSRETAEAFVRRTPESTLVQL